MIEEKNFQDQDHCEGKNNGGEKKKRVQHTWVKIWIAEGVDIHSRVV